MACLDRVFGGTALMPLHGSMARPLGADQQESGAA